jgi:hypothetical protein
MKIEGMENSMRIMEAIRNSLNEKEGQEIVAMVFAEAEKAGKLTLNNVEKFKEQFLMFLFASMVHEHKDLLELVSEDIWKEFRK